MLEVSSDLLQVWLSGLFVPLSRILGFFAVVPLLGDKAISIPVKMGLALMLTLIVAQLIPARPAVDLLSMQGVLVIAQQMIVGLALGLTVRIVFAAVDLAGQVSGLLMGFGFASFLNPESGASETAIATMFTTAAMLVFVSMDGHLMLITALVESFYNLPLEHGVGDLSGMNIARLGSEIFNTGLQLAMPVVAIMLITNMALAVLTRAAPQLNIFGIGFPVTLMVGMLMVALMLPSLAVPFQRLIERSVGAMELVLKK